MVAMSTWRKLHDHPELWERYFIREKVICAIRGFFEKEKFHEIETPILIAHPPAESYLDVFETQLLDRARRATSAYLSTSPEVPLKKLIAAGLGDCYSLTKSFRNMETQSRTHNPEFTIAEWYRVGADYLDIMKDCEALLFAITGSNTLIYQGKKIDLTPPWERITVADAFQKYAHVHFDDFFDMHNAKEIVKKKGYTVETHTTWEQLYNQIFLNEVEPHFGHGKPTIVYEFPGELAALAKKKASDPRFAERFEFYIGGLELGDAYSELTDPTEQEDRFKKEIVELKRLGKTTYEYDHDFIDALSVGLPKCSGIAVGVDRLVMLLADTKNIADTLFFPASEEFDII
jgi:elongation factor P--(R)-beta-lysine ligase